MSTVTELNWMGGSLTNAAKTEYSEGVSVKDKIDAVVADVDAVKAKTVTKNLLPKLTSAVNNGVTFTVNDDSSVTVTGTATGSFAQTARSIMIIPPRGKYILSRGDVPNSDAKVFLNAYNGNTYLRQLGTTIDNEIEIELDYNGYDRLFWGVTVAGGLTVEDVTVYPMLRDASVEDGTYEPYVMSNPEITDKLSDTGWISFVPNEAIKAKSNYQCNYRRKNGFVTVSMVINTSEALPSGLAEGTTGVIAFTLPEGFRPEIPQINSAITVQGGTDATGHMQIIRGDVRIALFGNIPANTYWVTSVTYPVN